MARPKSKAKGLVVERVEKTADEQVAEVKAFVATGAATATKDLEETDAASALLSAEPLDVSDDKAVVVQEAPKSFAFTLTDVPAPSSPFAQIRAVKEVVAREGEKSPAGVCNCSTIGVKNWYEGCSWTCSVHEPIQECPKCHCVQAERMFDRTNEITRYQCNICGIFYSRNRVTGEYTH